jgi:hypothetical protein
LAIIVSLFPLNLANSQIFKDKILPLLGLASLGATIAQIVIEAVFIDRYRSGGSQEWLLGCEILSTCSTDQGPSSAVSQIYNEVDSMMRIVVAEIIVNVVSLILMVVSLYVTWSQASSSQSQNQFSSFVLVLEALLEIGQVVCSALALEQMEGSIQPVNQLLGSLIGMLSENNGLCVLPCCSIGTESGSPIAC